MWPDAYSKPADSDPDYTLDSEEPVYSTANRLTASGNQMWSDIGFLVGGTL